MGKVLLNCSFILLLLAACLAPVIAKGYANKIKHVVVLMEENRSFDHMLGWYKGGVNGLTGNEFNQVNASNPSSAKVFVDATAPYVAPCDPDHSTPATTYKVYGSTSDSGAPTMGGFVGFENNAGHASTNYCAVMKMQDPTRVPIITSLASNFVAMDRFFCAHPGPTWPNRLFMLTATSAGDTETGVFYQDKVGHLYPQKTIFDQVSAAGLTWRNYYNDTPWEFYLETIVLHPENLANMEKFYDDAKTGNLPAFSWINPRAAMNKTLNQGSNDQHPDHDVALGERYYKDIYEALRASPAWNDTLYIITYDEHGGFYDHVPPPVNVPVPDDSTSYPDANFKFNRLGVRIPTILISPWLAQGVESGPPALQKPANNSEYTLTSIMATARILLGIPTTPLTKRDEWSATFEHLFETLDSPRTDCPLHLPDAPPPSQTFEETLPVNSLQRNIMGMHAHLTGVEFPKEVVNQGQVSEWLQIQFEKHVENTMNWKRQKSSPSFSLSSIPISSSSSSNTSLLWRVNKGIRVSYFTLSTPQSMCLDYKGEENKREIGVSPCYPREDPDSSLDHSQRWIWSNDDSSLRPVSLSSSSSHSRHSFGTLPLHKLDLCLSRESFGVVLRECDDSKDQKWDFVEDDHFENEREIEGFGEIRTIDGREHLVVV